MWVHSITATFCFYSRCHKTEFCSWRYVFTTTKSITFCFKIAPRGFVARPLLWPWCLKPCSNRQLLPFHLCFSLSCTWEFLKDSNYPPCGFSGKGLWYMALEYYHLCNRKPNQCFLLSEEVWVCVCLCMSRWSRSMQVREADKIIQARFFLCPSHPHPHSPHQATAGAG